MKSNNDYITLSLRLYTPYDSDIISLHYSGYSLSKILNTSLYYFACGIPCKIYVEEEPKLDIDKLQPLRFRTFISNRSSEICDLISNIKTNQRNAFCKTLLRDTLIYSHLQVYLIDDKYNKSIFTLKNLTSVTDRTCLLSIRDFRSDNKISNIIPIAKPKPDYKHKIGYTKSPDKPYKSRIMESSATAEIKNDKTKQKVYNMNVTSSSASNVTDLLDEFPGLFG